MAGGGGKQAAHRGVGSGANDAVGTTAGEAVRVAAGGGRGVRGRGRGRGGQGRRGREVAPERPEPPHVPPGQQRAGFLDCFAGPVFSVVRVSVKGRESCGDHSHGQFEAHRFSFALSQSCTCLVPLFILVSILRWTSHWSVFESNMSSALSLSKCVSRRGDLLPRARLMRTCHVLVSFRTMLLQ